MADTITLAHLQSPAQTFTSADGNDRRRRWVCLLALLLGLVLLTTIVLSAAASATDSSTTVLYDGTLGTLPGAQAFTFLAFPAGPTQTITNNGVLLDSTPPGSDSAGYFSQPALTPTLARAQGYTITFQVQVIEETHTSSHRAGFSLIALSDDVTGTMTVTGIELGFWEGEIWAQDDDQQGGTLFTHAEGAAFDTTAGLVQYDLVVVTDTYRLLADGVRLLNGRLRDYTNFSGFPDPYETPNFIFLGDDTSAAAARVQINHVAVTIPGDAPPPPTFAVYLPVIQRP